MRLFRSSSYGRRAREYTPLRVYALSSINAISQNRLLIINPLRMPRAASKFGVSEISTTRRRWPARRFGVVNAIDINRRTVYSYIKA
jgi:hypothetical protein